MKLSNEFQPIRDWAEQKGIIGPNGKGDIKTQSLKLVEEAGELASAVLNKDQMATADAIGDMVVVLTSIAEQNSISIEWCIMSAYETIAKRTGKMENGTFVKDK